MSEETTLAMVFAFDDPSSSYVNGFELGMIWQEIDGDGKLIVDRGFGEGLPIHAENVETLRRMAVACGYKLETRPEKDGWVPIRLSYVGTGNARPALSIVSK